MVRSCIGFTRWILRPAPNDREALWSSTHSSLAPATASPPTQAFHFIPIKQLHLHRADLDLGSSAVVLLPDAAGSNVHRHLAISAGKEGRIYLLDRDQMGRFHAGDDSQIVQSLEGAIGPLYGGPAYFN